MGALKPKRSILGFLHLVEAAPTADTEPANEDETIQTGDFRIDVGKRTASVLGKELALTAAEFDLLVYLVKHPRRVITSRTQLTTKWEGNHVQRIEFFRVLVSLSKKLERETASSQYIRTEPWIIYRFNPHTAR
jgi:DNA-binding response OmpR family regulator